MGEEFAVMGVTLEEQHRIEQFLYHEADLLDSWRFTEWLDLFHDDVHYWMPTRVNRARKDRSDDISAPGDMAVFEDTKASLAMRVARLDTGRAWAEDPPSRTRHLVTNVMATRLPLDADEVPGFSVRSAFIVYRNQGDRTDDLWAGAREDVLLEGGPAGFLVRQRTIRLDQAVISAKSVSVFF